MHHKLVKPNFKSDKQTVFSHKYRLKDVNSIKLSSFTILGGWDYVQLSKTDKLMYVLRGTGSMRSPNRHLGLAKGTSFEAPCDQEIKISGQVEYLCVEPKDEGTIGLKEEHHNGTWKNLDSSKDGLLFITEGLGYARDGKKTFRLEYGNFLEIKEGSTFELNGNLKYLHFTK